MSALFAYYSRNLETLENKIIIVDDDLLVAMSLKTILEADHHIEVLCTGQDGREAVKLYEKYTPDVMLMDIQMKEMSGLDAVERIITKDEHAKILLLTTFLDDEIVHKIPELLQTKEPFNFNSYDINEKERAIIEQVAKGNSNKEIAEELCLSEGTVRNYLSTILEKLCLRDRTQMAVFYYQNIKK
jgi:DNA-binding NarL/FixJ family response regulator